MFLRYDQNDPFRKVMIAPGVDFLLNFESTRGALDTPTVPVVDDGKDDLFGDFGNDWLVGGTNEDHLWGGYGDDLLNGDDNHDTTLGTADPTANNKEDGRDIGPTFADFLFGGAGRDVLYANTFSDRVYDWAGELNTYVIAYNPFGNPAINRAHNGAIDNLLYSLSKSDGADPTRGSGPRQGEPYGEIALLDTGDADIGDQTGGPRDPQNIKGAGKPDKNSLQFGLPAGAPSATIPVTGQGITVQATDSAGAEQAQNTIVFKVTRAGNTTVSTAVTLVWGGTATLTTDYAVAVSGATISANRLTLTFAAGQATAIVTVTPVDDTANEGAETVNLTLAAGTGYTVGTASSASGTIVDNDGALFAAEAPAGATADRLLTESALEAVVAQAKSAWREVMPNADFHGITVTIGALPGQLLGFTLGKTITIDPTAAGWGWSVIYPDSGAPRMDLLFTVMHELGHALGFVEDDPAQPVVMGRTLSAETGHTQRRGPADAGRYRADVPGPSRAAREQPWLPLDHELRRARMDQQPQAGARPRTAAAVQSNLEVSDQSRAVYPEA